VSAPVDFDLHGLVTVRLLGARPGDVATVERQLGPIRTPAPLAGEPDVVLRFVERIEPRGRLRTLGLRDGAFDDQGFLLLRSRYKSATRVRMPLDQVGGRCEIVCEHGVAAVPLLVAIVNLTALGRGALPLHACAFEFEGAGAVVTGWSKGGKTETLLAFARRGARYVADEWCYVLPDGRTLFGVPEPVRLWHWQLAQLPDLARRVPRAARARMAAFAAIPRLADALPRALERSAAGRALRRLAALLEPQTNVLVPPARLFGAPVAAGEARFTHLFWSVSTAGGETRAEPVDAQQVADRVVHSLRYERAPLAGYYEMFRFAFPELSNPWLEKAAERERDLVRRAFAGKPAWRVEHPYPVEIERLYECMAPLLRGAP
jgi:hypothetical protein